MTAALRMPVDEWRRQALTLVDARAEASPVTRRAAWAFLRQHGAAAPAEPDCSNCRAWSPCDAASGYCMQEGLRCGWRTAADYQCDKHVARATCGTEAEAEVANDVRLRRSPDLMSIVIPCPANE